MKRKMKLQLDELAVEAFETTAAKKEARGTVRGHEGSLIPGACSNEYTCFGSCPDTCGYSCWYTDCPTGECCPVSG